MKKISVLIFLAFIISSLTMFNVSAADPDDTFYAPKLFYPVVADGKIDGNEWDDANAVVLETTNAVMNAFGRYQGGDEDFFANFKATFKIKWDENNLYILEVREDTDKFVFEPDNALAPWEGCGTLFFISYDNGDPKWANAYEPFWTPKSGDGKPKVALRAFLEGRDGPFDRSDDPEWVGNWKYGATVTEGAVHTSVFEIIIPWSDIQKFQADIGMKTPVKTGDKFKFTPITPKHREDGSTGQMNYHDKYGRDDAVTDENDNPGELPINWAPMVLIDAIIAPEPEPEPEPEPAAPVAAVDTPAVTPAPSAPRPGDNAVIIFAALILAAGAFMASKRFAKSK